MKNGRKYFGFLVRIRLVFSYCRCFFESRRETGCKLVQEKHFFTFRNFRRKTLGSNHYALTISFVTMSSSRSTGGGGTQC